ncbi:MAG: EAL domain-containing protein [Pseudobutyrivibrio sp.]|nr:EAL domain-containing protein [Pseudobutyrivibrio sp.]
MSTLQLFTILFLMTAFVAFAEVVYILNKHSIKGNKLSMSVVRLILTAIFTILVYTACINTKNELMAEIFYALYFSSIDWILMLFIYYARQYTNVWDEKSAAPLLIAFVAVADNISLYTNSIWHHAFRVYKQTVDSGGWFYNFEANDYYAVHLTFSYIMVAIIIAIFVRKVFTTSGFHRKRYTSVLIMFFVLILLNVAYLFANVMVDVSITFYGIGTLFIGYYTLMYNPKTLVEYMLATITERMECALIAFDEADNCVYSNQFADRMFGVKTGKKIFDERFKKWKDGRDTNSIANNTWSAVYNMGGDEYRFDVHFNKLYDKHGYYSGCYFSFYDVTGDYLAYEEEKYRSTHDPLTDALNRESFYVECKKMLEENPYTDYVMVCSNIKGFKLINDMFGLEAADRVLIRIADSIRSKMQKGSVYARLEADRFAVFMPKERYTEELFMEGMNEVSSLLNNSQYKMTILVGVYEIYDRNVSIASMCDGAFLAIDSIKNSFKNTIAYYGDMLRFEYMNEQKILGEFETALGDGQFAIFLQPVISMDGQCNLCEALVRWVHPERGIIAPATFIPLLENTGYIYKLDAFVWEQAAKRLAFWNSRGFKGLSISVNISVKDFYYIDIYETLVNLVRKYDIEPSRLKLEITESVFMNEKERQIGIINRLREYGFFIEIDDFGSGYSSLNMLKELPANILKMDMAFLSFDKKETRGQKIVNTIVALAKTLDMQVIVEGVETEDQVEFIKETGADYMQGYYFDRPLTIKQFEEKYLK